MGRINQKTDRVYPVDYMFKKVEELTNLLEGEVVTTKEKVDAHDSLLAEKAKHIKNNFFNVAEYESYKNGTDWSPAIDVIFALIQTLGSGTIYFPRGTYNISKPLPVKTHVYYEGDGYMESVINYTTADSNNILTINVKSVEIRRLGFQGNAGHTGNGIYVIGTSASPIGELRIDDIMVKTCGDSGFKVGEYVFMSIFTNIKCIDNIGTGAWIAGTDNTYVNIHTEGNDKHGVWLAGANNRVTNIKATYDGRTSPEYAGIYITGGRLLLSGLESQDARYDGIVFDGCVETEVASAVSDACGYAVKNGTETNVTARGFVFKNGCKNIKASLMGAGYYSSPVCQLRPIDIDGTCSWLDIRLDYNDKRYTTPTMVINSTMAVKVSTPVSQMVDKFTKSGKILNNLMINPTLSSSTAWASSSGVAKTYNGDTTVTLNFDASAIRRVDIANSALVTGHVYYFSVKVKADVGVTINTSVFRSGSSYNNGNIVNTSYAGTGNWINVEYLVYMYDANTNFHLTIGPSQNNVAITAKEAVCVDLTNDLGVLYAPTSSYNINPDFISQLMVNSGGFFTATRTL